MSNAAAPTVLARILDQTRATVDRRRRRLPRADLQARALAVEPAPGRFRDALARPGIGVIAEFKRRSPSAGELRSGARIAEIAHEYEQGGARAMSVLTEEQNFEGSLDDLRAACAACALPLLRKDFVIDDYQLYEARAAQASAVLLIVAALTDGQLEALHKQALAIGLDPLVEVHNAEELDRAAAVGARIIGVNNRDLRDFSVDVHRTYELLSRMPAGALVVSESGIATLQQVSELEREGVSAVLVGEALMRAEVPRQALAELLVGSRAL